MINIIRPGKIGLRKIERFVCQHCECIFEADQDYYAIRDEYDENYLEAICPYCHGFVYIDLKKRK